MVSAASPTLAQAIAAAQEWWRDAGVDCHFADDPQVWLADPEAEQAKTVASPAATAAPPPPPPTRPRIGGDAAQWPQDLAGWRQWWLTEQSLDSGGMNPRVAPRGAVGSPLMVLVPMPEKPDTEILLSGQEGRLIAGFAHAAGIDPEQVHVMAALPRHMAAPDWAGLVADGMGDVLRHYIAMAAPQRLLVLGRRILPLIGHDPAQGAHGRLQLSIQGHPSPESIPLLAHFAPERLLERAPLRAQLWRAWLDWTDGTQ